MSLSPMDPHVDGSARMRRMAKPPMIQRTYRVPVELYEAVMEIAEQRQENLSDVLREALEEYRRKGVEGK